MKKSRKPNRLKEFDYSTPAAYFVTICVKNKKRIFGEITDGKINLNKSGLITEFCWNDLPNHYLNIELDEYIIMPDHVHGIINIVGNGLKPFRDMGGSQPFRDGKELKSIGGFNSGNGYKPFPTGDGVKMHGLPEIVRGFKTFSSRRINELNPDNRFQWQKSYYDRIVRNENELTRIRAYIRNNPTNWTSL